jgi:integrase
MNIPVDMSRDEIRNVINLIEGTPQVIVKILYRSGLRISEAIRLRVQDIDYI